MLKIKKISHVAMVVESLDQALEKFGAALGLSVESREHVASQQVDAAFLPIGDAGIELIESKGNEGVKRFLEKRGPGLHHVAIEVEGIEGALELLKSLSVPLIDERPRVGAHGHKVAFIHPKATGGLLIELVEPIQAP
jgi:methylmalonyl-CoA/ethylmalonyl-CoA epimerase